MPHVIHRLAYDRAELVEYPSERIIAAGSVEAVIHAADLIAGKSQWNFATPHDEALRDTHAQVDREAFGD